MHTLSFPGLGDDAESYTGLDNREDVREALLEECRKVYEDNGSQFFANPPTEEEIDRAAEREAADLLNQMWPCSITATSKLPDGTKIQLTNTD